MRKSCTATAIAVGLLLLTVASAAYADAFKDGIAAGNLGDFDLAKRILEPLATDGDARAQFAMGQIFHRGYGGETDYEKALAWYERAAAQGNANAESNIGVMYATGQGVPQDYDIAERWFRRAADKGNQDAKDNLGVIMRRRLSE